MIGYCGYGCHRCAARSDDPGVRQGRRKVFGHEPDLLLILVESGLSSSGVAMIRQGSRGRE